MVRIKEICSYLLLLTYIVVFMSSCSTDKYYSPLNELKVEELCFDYSADSCSLSINNIDPRNITVMTLDEWCSVNVSQLSLDLKVASNETIDDRETKVTLYDIVDETTLVFIVKQKLNPIALRNTVQIESIELISPQSLSYTPFLISDSAIHIYIPREANVDSMFVKLTHTGNAALINDTPYAIQDSILFDFSVFTKPNIIRCTSERGVKRTWKINIYDLPVFVISTPDNIAITSKKERVEGCEINLIDGNSISVGTAGIKGRGNSTWQQPKKPYNIKLDSKKSILGMPKSKHWVLLSHPFYDRTQLHNDVAFEIARKTDYKWVQSGEFVELIMNGEHQGLYYLCEKVRIEKGKIDIADITPTDTLGDALTGGYLLETDNGPHHDKTSFTTDYYNMTGVKWETLEPNVVPLYWLFSNPEEDIPSAQYNYIVNYMNHLESLIYNDSTLTNGEYRNYLDIETAINWWIVENLCVNEEASRTKNLTVYKDRNSSVGGGKLTIGPPWDFDYGSFGDFGPDYGILFAYDFTWCFKRLFDDPYFVNRLKEKWNNYYSLWKNYIPNYIDQQFNLVHRSALRNEKMWPNWLMSAGTWEESVLSMKESFAAQLEWMHVWINNL